MLNKGREKKTALVLGGGGARGAYEAGVWMALEDMGIKIDIVTGTSIGAVNGAMVAQGDLDRTVRLWKEIETGMIIDLPEEAHYIEYAKDFIKNKGADTSGMKQLFEECISEERIRKSPVDFGVVVVEFPSMKPQFVFKEDMEEGKLIDYIMASASLFPALRSHTINDKEYIDGGYADVLPIAMALEKGATEVIAVKLNGLGVLDHDTLENTENLTLIESKWNLGLSLNFDTDKARKNIKLGYLDAMKKYGFFDGEYFTFQKGTFSMEDMLGAEACGRVFGMDPTVIYKKELFLERLRDIISSKEKEFHKKGILSSIKNKIALKLFDDHILAADFIEKYNII